MEKLLNGKQKVAGSAIIEDICSTSALLFSSKYQGYH